MSLVDFSSDAFIVAFFLYCFAFMFYVIAIAGKKWSNRDPQQHEKRWGRIAFITSSLGLASHLTFFFTRWAGSGQIPTSNMYEFMTFLGMAIMIAFTIVYSIYRKPLLGMFSLPLTVIIVAYASVFPQEVQPLIPALNNYWLKVHVTTAALGEAFFAVGFAAGLMYLLRVVDFKGKTKEAKRSQFWVEFSLYSIILIVGFIVAVFAFRGMGYEAQFVQEKSIIDPKVWRRRPRRQSIIHCRQSLSHYNSDIVKYEPFLGMEQPLFEAPYWMNGANSGRKLNTVFGPSLQARCFTDCCDLYSASRSALSFIRSWRVLIRMIWMKSATDRLPLVFRSLRLEH